MKWALAALVVAALGVAAFVVLSDGGGSVSPREHAVRACDAAQDFADAVRRNDDVDTVRKKLQKARDEAGAAEKGNSLYTGLASGVEALNISIETNDGQAAKVGIDVVMSECGYVRRQAPGGS